MKAKTFTCTVCGAEFQSNASTAKYCPSCRRKAYKRQARLSEVHFSDDTPEMMALCLNCTRPDCGGECKKLADLVRQMSAEGGENGKISDANL